MEEAMAEAVEQLRSSVEVEVEALRQTLTAEGDEVMNRLEWASSKLRQQLDDLQALTDHCLDVSVMRICANLPRPAS